MLFSIIIPVYNTSKFLRKCFDSIINQTCHDYEVIIVNDGSTDNSVDIINTYLCKIDNIKIINKRNAGLASARNSGLNEATGEYIIHLDSDDWIENTYLSDLKEKISCGSFDMIICDYYVSYPTGTKHRKKDAVFIEDYISGNEYIAYFLKGGIQPAIWNKVCKKSLYLENNITFPAGISMGEDLATSSLLGYNAAKIGKLNSPYLNYVQHPLAMTKSFNKKGLQDLILALSRIETYFKNKNMDKLVHNFKVRQLTNSFFYSKNVIGCEYEYKYYLNLIKLDSEYYNPSLRKRFYFNVLKIMPFKIVVKILYRFNSVLKYIKN